MTIEQLIVFHKIVQTGSFKAASLDLHKTQPALSASIKKLEEELEVELFDRNAYRPALTQHGKTFFERSLKIIEGMEELEGLGLSFRQKEEPEISLSLDGISLTPEMLKLFKSFGEKNPFTKLNLSFDILSEAERKVLAGETQMGITHFLSAREKLEVVPMTHIQMLPVMSKELYQQRKVRDQNGLKDIEQIVVSDRNGPKGASFGLLENGRKWHLGDANFKREVILAGLGWGHLPGPTIEREIKEKKLVVLNFEDIHPRSLEIYLIRLKKNILGPVSRRLWDELISFHL